MAPHIVSWGANAPAASPASSSSASVVSFESITSDIQLPKAPEDATETGTNPVNTSTGEASAGQTPTSSYPGIDDSFLRHDTYFFKDGNITFLVDGTLYCVHRFFFSRDSVYFSTRLAQLGTRDHEALTTVVSLGDVEREDFEALLAVIYPKDFEEHNLSYQQWKSVLHLSTRWGFASIRKLALKSIKPPTPHDQLILARTHAVDQWVLPALTALCERAEPLSLTEARQMRIEDVVLVATVREDVRKSFFIPRDTAKVTQVVQAALAGKLPHNEGNGAFGGAAKQGSSSMTVALHVGAKQEDSIQSSVDKLFWPGKDVAKSSDETAARVEQAAPKPSGFGGLFGATAQAAADSPFVSFASSSTTGKQRPVAGNVSKKPSTSTHEPGLFSFGQGGAAPPSPSLAALVRSAETSSPSPEPTARKSKTPGTNPTGSKAPEK